MVPFGTIANGPGKANLFELFTTLGRQLRGLSLLPSLVLATLVRDPVSQTRDLTETRNEDVAMRVLVGHQEIKEPGPVVVTTRRQRHMKKLEDLDLLFRKL